MADKKFTERDLLESGAILKEYTQTDFITVSPAPAIGKVQFSIVKQGTKGKDCSNFYLDTEKFRLLCQDLCSISGAKKLSENLDHPYPDVYKYIAGTEGSKHLNIGGGRKGIRIQIQEKRGGAWDNRMVTVPYNTLQSMKFRFELVMGLIPATHYYKSLIDAYWRGAEQRDKYYRKAYNESGDGEYQPKVEPPTVANPTSTKADMHLKNPEPAIADEPAGKVSVKSTNTTSNAIDGTHEKKPEVLIYTVQTLGAVKRSGNTYYCPVKDTATENQYNLCFTAKYLSAMGDNWQKFQESSANGVKIRIHGAIQNKNMQFIDIAS